MALLGRHETFVNSIALSFGAPRAFACDEAGIFLVEKHLIEFVFCIVLFVSSRKIQEMTEEKLFRLFGHFSVVHSGLECIWILMG